MNGLMIFKTLQNTVQNLNHCLFMAKVQLLVTLCEIISPY